MKGKKKLKNCYKDHPSSLSSSRLVSSWSPNAAYFGKITTLPSSIAENDIILHGICHFRSAVFLSVHSPNLLSAPSLFMCRGRGSNSKGLDAVQALFINSGVKRIDLITITKLASIKKIISVPTSPSALVQHSISVKQ